MKFYSLLIGLFFVGCTTGRQIDLEEKWRPLIAVKEGTDKLFVDGMTTTIGQYCYVSDLKQWNLDYPPGSIDRDAVLLHEQEHSKRELATGLPLWLSLYVTDSRFRWQEERIGYELQIRHYYQNGRAINPEVFAQTVSQDYKVLGEPMVSYSDALTWVMDLITKIGQGQ